MGGRENVSDRYITSKFNDDPGMDNTLVAMLGEEIKPKQETFSRGASGQRIPAQAAQCAGCGGSIPVGQYLNAAGETYHPQCLKCNSCGKGLADVAFMVKGNKPYCKGCVSSNPAPAGRGGGGASGGAKFCTGCGGKLTAGAKFCTGCGAKV